MLGHVSFPLAARAESPILFKGMSTIRALVFECETARGARQIGLLHARVAMRTESVGGFFSDDDPPDFAHSGHFGSDFIYEILHQRLHSIQGGLTLDNRLGFSHLDGGSDLIIDGEQF